MTAQHPADLVGGSASWRTTLAIHERSGAFVEHRADHIIVRTPENPDYHWGNCLLVTGDSDDVTRWLGVFAAELPDAAYRAIGLLHPPRSGGWTDAGFDLETERTLSTSSPLTAATSPEGYEVALVQGEVWDSLLELNCADRPPSPDHRRFQQRRLAANRRLVETGCAAWFAALGPDGDAVASLGIAVLGSQARYQSVLTAADHRRRGLARHLLGVASAWAFERGARELIIVADEGEDGDRLYRRAGFVPGAIEHSAYAATWPITGLRCTPGAGQQPQAG